MTVCHQETALSQLQSLLGSRSHRAQCNLLLNILEIGLLLIDDNKEKHSWIYEKNFKLPQRFSNQEWQWGKLCVWGTLPPLWHQLWLDHGQLSQYKGILFLCRKIARTKKGKLPNKNCLLELELLNLSKKLVKQTLNKQKQEWSV